MAGGFVTMPQVLQVIGQAPNQHGRKTAIENLRAVKSLFPMFGVDGKLPAQMQEMVDKVMKDGPAALSQNPMAAITGALQGQISGVAGQLGGLIGQGGMLSALTGPGGLQAAAQRLLGTAGSLSGAGGTGSFDINSVIGHASMVAMGSNVPVGMGLDRVLGPIYSSEPMQTAINTVQRVGAIAAGRGDTSGMIAEVLSRTATLNGIVDASNAALTQGLQTTLGISTFSVMADGLDPARQDNNLLDFFRTIVLPEVQDAIALHHEQMASEADIRSGRVNGVLPDYTPPEGLEEP